MAVRTQAAAIQRALGADVEIPDWDQVRQNFDAWLFSEPVRADPDELTLRTALGLTAGR